MHVFAGRCLAAQLAASLLLASAAPAALLTPRTVQMVITRPSESTASLRETARTGSSRSQAREPRRRSLTDILRLLELIKEGDRRVWFTHVRIDMDGRIKLSGRSVASSRMTTGITNALSVFKKHEGEFRSVRLTRITWEPDGQRTVAAFEMDIVLNDQ